MLKTKPKEWHNYISSARTLYRMMWFTDFLGECFGQLCDDKSLSFATCAINAYNKALGPHHNWVIRTSAKTGLLMAPSREYVLDHIFGGPEKSIEIPVEERYAKIKNL